MGGMQVLEQIIETDPAAHVILMTADYSAESAWRLSRSAPAITGTSRFRSIYARVDPHLVEEARKRKRSLQAEDELRANSGFEGIVGSSRPMYEMLSRVLRVAPYYRTALIVGETGTGKDLVARALHQLSPVAEGPMSCSIVPPWWRRCLKASCSGT